MPLPRLGGGTLALLLATLAHAQPLNIVMFVADDHGQDAGCYGNPVLKTEHMDALARIGTRYTHAFCTTASCSASRSVILTGIHNHANGQYGHQHAYHRFQTRENLRSLPRRLADAGYRTARVGKYHVAPESVYPFGEVLKAPSRNPVKMAEAARAFLERKGAAPFFLYFATSDPHRGGGFARELPEAPDRFGNRPRGYDGVQDVRYAPEDVIVPGFLPDTKACRAELAQYYQSISRVDQGLGRVLEILRGQKLLENTAVLYLSDHGIAMPGAKTTLYEGGMRSPLLVYVPGRPGGHVSSALVSWVDLTPTVLELAGVPSEKNAFHGRSFVRTIGQDAKGQEFLEVYASHTFHEITMYYPMRVVRTQRYKLIHNLAHPLPFPFATDLWAAPTWQAQWKQGPQTPYGAWTVHSYQHRPEFELYDLEKDPNEGKNLAADPAHAAVLITLKQRLVTFRKRTKDPWVIKFEHE